MFGLAVWDARRRRAVISRDRLGIKPLYYARAGDLLLFASELKGLLASGLVEPELDVEAIDAYLSFGFFPAPRTPLAFVSKLLPGHSLIVADGEVTVEQFWEYPLWAASPDRRPVESYAEELLDLLDESVRLRLMSDVPLGAMLSGGIDSSIIVALMARHMSEPVRRSRSDSGIHLRATSWRMPPSSRTTWRRSITSSNSRSPRIPSISRSWSGISMSRLPTCRRSASWRSPSSRRAM